MASVTDVAGLNTISAQILANAAAAMAGMVSARAGRARRRTAVGRRDDVRRHHAVRRPARARCWRSAATRCSCSTRPARAGGRWRRWSRQAPDRRARHHDHRALRRTGRRRAVRRAGPAGGRGPRGRAAGGLARRAGHGQLRPARHRPAAVRRPQPVRAQPVGDPDAHDAARSAPSSAGGSRPSCRPRPDRPCSSSRCGGVSRSTPRASPSTTPRPTLRCSRRSATVGRLRADRAGLQHQRRRFAEAMAAKLDELLR